MLKPITPEGVNRICCLVISKYGIGKTSLIKTILGQEYVIAPEAGMAGQWLQMVDTNEKVCVLSAESGLLAVRDLVLDGSVEGYEISSIEEFNEAYDNLSTSHEMMDRYDWIFIDSLTEISSRCDEKMKEQFPDQEKAFRRWDEYTALMKSLVKGFRDLTQYNVVFTCLETVDKDQNNRRYIAPAVKGKGIKEELPSYFDEVLYMAIDQNYRVIYTQPYMDYPAKDRSGKLNPIEAPNLLTIKNKILGGN